MATSGEGGQKDAQKSEGKERRRGTDSMLRHKILIISGESNMRRSLKRLMTATGALVEFVTDLTKLPPGCAFAPRCAYRIDKCAEVPPLVACGAPGHMSACWEAERLAKGVTA